MDMKFAVEYAKENKCWDIFGEACRMDALDDDEYIQIFKLAGMPDDAAEFMAEWYPELVISAITNLRYTYGFDHKLRHYRTEEELSAFLEWLEVSEEEYQEKYGFIIRDAAFNGVVVYDE